MGANWNEDEDDNGARGTGDGYLAAEQLVLADEDERLPWLEGGDDEYAEQGVDTGRIFGFALLALLALAVLVGGIWWFGNRGSDTEYVADGSTIQAPAGSYREKPADPGGARFDEGNLAPAVGEGKSREGRIAESAPRAAAAAPGIATARPADQPRATANGANTDSASSSSTGGVPVQVGAYSSKAAAEAGWQKLQSQTDKLNGVSHRVVQGQADIGTVFRLQAVAGDAAGASRLCSALKGDGVACQVKR